MNSRLALGTAQFGLSYGISNRNGQISLDEADAILAKAWEAGLDTLDTAISYGESELRLGEMGVGKWKVISKLQEVPESCPDVSSWVKSSVIGSIERLGVSRLYGLLLHHPQQLLGIQGDSLYAALEMLKDQNLVEKIGVSIYDPIELDSFWPTYQFDLVQAPFNVLDRRLITSGWLNRLHQGGTEVHIRSVFLQGLLLVDAVNRPEKFNRWQPLWDQWYRWLADQGLTPLQACLSFAMLQPDVSRVIVGVDNLKHLEEIISASDRGVVEIPDSLDSSDLNLINPSVWSNL
jgi:aryl-alcohol dehydrogenase-like predicted oxidoreductase